MTQTKEIDPETILAFDCSGASCSAAVLRRNEVLAANFAEMARGQAETLVPMIARTMAMAGVTFDDLDAIATTIGPGSFTGLRIGIATARGLGFAARRPILCVTSFAAIHAGLDAAQIDEPIAVLIDSRRGPVFCQLFEAGGRPAGPALALEPDQVRHWAGAATRLAGDGVPLLPGSAELAPDRIKAESVAIAARCAGDQIVEGAAPLYLRAPDVTLPRLEKKSS